MSNDKKIFVNISTRPFEQKVYNETSPKAFSYKPDTGFWGAIKKDNEYFSEWDKEYGLDLCRNFNSDSSLYITSFGFSPEKVYFLRPSQDELLLEGFNNFIKSSKQDISAEEKRKLLVAFLKDKKGLQELEHVICQIDLDLDMIEMERIFGNFNRGEENSEEVFKNLGMNMRKAFIECFSGVEVTEPAIDEYDPSGYDIISCASWTAQENPGYINQPGFWDVPSIAVFDTSAFDIIETRELKPEEIDEIEEAREQMTEETIGEER